MSPLRADRRLSMRAAPVVLTVAFTVPIAAALFALTVWPTFWTYGVERQGLKRGGFIDVPVRRHRITGAKQSRIGDEWHDGSVLFD